MKRKLFSRTQLLTILIGCLALAFAAGCKKDGKGWDDARYKENYQLYFDNPNPKTGQPYTDAERAVLTYDPGAQENFLPVQPVVLSLVLSKDISRISILDGSNLSELSAITQATPQGDKYVATINTTTDDLKIEPGSFKVLKFDITYKDGSIGSIQFKVVVKKPLPPISEILVGHWKFDDPANLTKATLGNDLVLAGTMSQSSVPGPEAGNLAVSKGLSTWYELNHGLPAAGGAKVNVYTILMDVRKPASSTGYAALYQPNIANSTDAATFIAPNGGIYSTGGGTTGSGTVKPDTWYRILITVAPGDYRTYVNGKLTASGTPAADGKYALDLSKMLLFADNDGEDDVLQVSELMLFNNTFTDDQASALPGVGKPLD